MTSTLSRRRHSLHLDEEKNELRPANCHLYLWHEKRKFRRQHQSLHNVNQQDQLHHSQIQPQLGYPNHQHQQQHGEVVQQNQTRMSRVIRASEYKNLRKVVPSLKRQRDVGKVEVVTEAARYIDHLHKTLIERFVACGIPDSLKEILGTDDVSTLGSQHIMNLVTQMAAKQRLENQTSAGAARQQATQVAARRRRPQQHLLPLHPPKRAHLDRSRRRGWRRASAHLRKPPASKMIDKAS